MSVCRTFKSGFPVGNRILEPKWKETPGWRERFVSHCGLVVVRALEVDETIQWTHVSHEWWKQTVSNVHIWAARIGKEFHEVDWEEIYERKEQQRGQRRERSHVSKATKWCNKIEPQNVYCISEYGVAVFDSWKGTEDLLKEIKAWIGHKSMERQNIEFLVKKERAKEH
jgi:hypothetical protein